MENSCLETTLDYESSPGQNSHGQRMPATGTTDQGMGDIILDRVQGSASCQRFRACRVGHIAEWHVVLMQGSHVYNLTFICGAACGMVMCEMEFPRKSGQRVKGYGGCSYSAGVTYPSDECRRGGCRRPRCTRRCWPWPPLWSGSPRGEPVPSSGRRRSSPRGVVPALADAAHAALDPVLAQEPLVVFAGVLAAPVGVGQQPVWSNYSTEAEIKRRTGSLVAWRWKFRTNAVGSARLFGEVHAPS